MKPITISEKLMFTTIRLETLNGSSGTGFFYTFNLDNRLVPVVITNKHVVNYNENEAIKFSLHLKNIDDSSDEHIEITYQPRWYFHSTYDLCFTPMNPLFDQIKRDYGRDVFYSTINEDLVYSDEKLKELSALEEVVMVGYPIGLWDSINNFPIFRKGYTSAHPAYDFNQVGIGLVDIASFPGSSGSPIFIMNESSYSDKKGNVFLGEGRLVFIGILFAGPQYTANGSISVINIPTQQNVVANTPIMANLGYYIKAKGLEEFKELIRTLL